jgi:RNA polymerase sigma-70 factor (ECF subfamily)
MTAAATTGTETEAAGTLVGSLFVEHGRAILGLCRLLLRDPVEAEDAAQQTFLSAHRALVAGGRPHKPAAWLSAIARNECRARLRLRPREALPLPELPADLPDPLARAIRNADLDALWAALAELPRRQRRAFLLRELGGLSYSELGAALGLSRPAVESLLFRARQQLRGAMAGGQAVLAPAAVRDRLADLIPSFDPASASAVGRVAALPVAAKLATATVGVGLLASGAAGLHERHAPAAARPAPAATTAPEQAPRVVRRAAHAVRPVPVVVVVRPSEADGRSGPGPVGGRGGRGRSGPPHQPGPRHDGDGRQGPGESEAPIETVPVPVAPAPVETTREEESEATVAPPTDTVEGGEDRGGGGTDGESGHGGSNSGPGKG